MGTLITIHTTASAAIAVFVCWYLYNNKYYKINNIMIEITISTFKSKFFIAATNNKTKTLYTSAAVLIKDALERTLPTEAKAFTFTNNSVTMPRRYQLKVSTSTNDFGFKIINFTFIF